MQNSSIERAEELIATNDPAKIMEFFYASCGCMGKIEGEPLCRCAMISREIRSRISFYALYKLNRIVFLKKQAHTIDN